MGCTVILGAALLPLRSHLSISTAALILVIPVVFGAVVGGIVAGTVSVIAGFVAFDLEFIPPYRTLSVGASQNWVALAVYVIVMLLVAQVVARLDTARTEAQHGRDVMHRLWELSELLVDDQPVSTLLRTIVTAVQTVFELPGVSLLILEDGHLVVAATAGEALSADELHQFDPVSGRPISLGTGRDFVGGMRTMALVASGRPVGMLAMKGLPPTETLRTALSTFANDAALALERAQLRDQALRTKLLEEVDRLRQGLMGAVSHDLRTPLATLKVASSTLLNRADSLSKEDTEELLHLIEIESDRLDRLVTNLLDMTRIEAGVLTLHRDVTSATALLHEAVRIMQPALREHRVTIHADDTLPPVDVDSLLIVQVIVNLLDNAVRHAPPNSVIMLEAAARDDAVVIRVADQGSGVEARHQDDIFNRFAQFDTGGRAGLGLTIAKTFVEAHGERIWYEDAPGGGACFAFSLPSAETAGGAHGPRPRH